jgi:hypothetical protein
MTPSRIPPPPLPSKQSPWESGKHMGQNYLAVVIDESADIVAFINPWDCKGGAKMKEVARMGNSFLDALTAAISPGGAYYKTRLVLAGMYASAKDAGGQQVEGSLDVHVGQNLYEKCMMKANEAKQARLEKCDKVEEPCSFIVNHTQKCFVDLAAYRGDYHPLPLLISEGNGRGGGDVQSGSPFIGAWARDVISMEKDSLNFTRVEFSLDEPDDDGTCVEGSDEGDSEGDSEGLDEGDSEGSVSMGGAASAEQTASRGQKRKRDDPPMRPEVLELYSKLPGLRKRLEAELANSKSKKAPWVGGGTAQAVMNHSYANHGKFLKTARVAIRQVEKLVGGEQRYIAQSEVSAASARDCKLSKLEARMAAKRLKVMQALDRQHDAAKSRIQRGYTAKLDADMEVYLTRMRAQADTASCMLDAAARGPNAGYAQWVADSRASMFISMLRDGRVINLSDPACMVCKSSKCIVGLHCPNHGIEYKLPEKPPVGGAGADAVAVGEVEGLLAKARAAISERTREVNGAIALFCAQQGACPIGLAPLAPEDAVAAMPCRHVFGRDALQDALNANAHADKPPQCPVCRARVCSALGYSGEKCSGLKAMDAEEAQEA